MFEIKDFGKNLFGTSIFAFGAGYSVKAVYVFLTGEWTYTEAYMNLGAEVFFSIAAILFAIGAVKGARQLWKSIQHAQN